MGKLEGIYLFTVLVAEFSQKKKTGVHSWEVILWIHVILSNTPFNRLLLIIYVSKWVIADKANVVQEREEKQHIIE